MSQAREAQALALALAEGHADPVRVLQVLDRLRALADDLAAIEARPVLDRCPDAMTFLGGEIRSGMLAEVVRLADRRGRRA